MELKTYLRILLKKWWIVLPAFLITFTTTLAFTYSQTPVYQTAFTFIVTPTIATDATRELLSGLSLLTARDEIANTYAEVVGSRTLRQLAGDKLGLSPEQAQGFSVDTRLLAGTNVLEVTVRGSDPQLTQDFAQSVSQEMMTYLRGLYEIYELKPLDQPALPRNPISPNTSLNLALGAGLGLILGISLAFLTEYLQAPPVKGTSFDILDETTGVYNKYYFLHRLGAEMVRSKRNRYNLSLALIRVNNVKLLKGINASKVRAEVLRQVALISAQHLREEDVVAYLGEDVFGVLLPDITGDNAKSIMEYLQTRTAWTPFESTVDDSKLQIKTVVGVVSYNHNGLSRDELVAKANQALEMAEVDQDGKAYLLSEVSEAG